MTRIDDLSRSFVALEQDSTVVTVAALSASSWQAAGMVPGVERRPLKKVDPYRKALMRLVERWREEAVKAGRTTITTISPGDKAGSRTGSTWARNFRH